MLAEPPPRVPRLEATTGTSYDRPRVERWRRALWLVLAAVGLSAAGCMGGDDETQPPLHGHAGFCWRDSPAFGLRREGHGLQGRPQLDSSGR